MIKKTFLLGLGVFAFGTATLISCGSSENKDKTHDEHHPTETVPLDSEGIQDTIPTDSIPPTTRNPVTP